MGATRILLLFWAVPSCTDATGSARHGTGLDISARDRAGWLRRLRVRADQSLRESSSEFGRFVAVIENPEGRDPCLPGPTGSPLGDALALVIACAFAAIRWQGRSAAELDALIGGSALPPPCPRHPHAHSRPATLTATGGIRAAHHRQREHPGDSASMHSRP
jgi:hypothetical protein